MATGPRYKVPMRRRRREVRTDYHQRLRLLKSGKPRLVARVSNAHVRAQLVTPGSDGDETHAAASSEELGEYGWDAPTGTSPARTSPGTSQALAVDAGLDEAVLDIGLNTATPGNKTFAVQEGAIDAGLEIPHNDDVLADWSRTRGEHIAAYAEQLDEPLYSGDFDAADLPEHFDDVLATIQEDHE